MKKKLKVAWCLDPFNEYPETWEKSGEVLSLMARSRDMSVVPLYCLSGEYLKWIDQPTPEFMKSLEPVLYEKVRSISLEMEGNFYCDPLIMLQDNSTKRGRAKELSKELKKQGFDLVVTNTHAMKGLSRAIFGSFSEQLLNFIEIPVLFVSPKVQSANSKKF